MLLCSRILGKRRCYPNPIPSFISVTPCGCCCRMCTSAPNDGSRPWSRLVVTMVSTGLRPFGSFVVVVRCTCTHSSAGFCYTTTSATQQHRGKKRNGVRVTAPFTQDSATQQYLLLNNIHIKRRNRVRVTAPFTQQQRRFYVDFNILGCQ